MSELGQQLREARLEKGMSLDDVQEMTKIRKRYLEAIEAGDYKVLPGNFYVRAFIKTYAETVGLNPDELLEGDTEVSSSQIEGTMEPIIQKRSSNRVPKERNVKWLSTVLMWTFPILIIVVIYLYVSSLEEKPSNKQVDSGQKITGDIKDPSITDDPVVDPEGIEGEPTPGNNTGEVNGGTDTPVEPPVEEIPPVEPQTVTVTEDGKKGKNTIFKVSGPKGAKVPVEIKASGESWLEVYRGKDSTGEKLSFGNTKDGDVLNLELDGQNMLIKSGYSPATIITVAGQPITDGKTTTRIILEMDTTDTDAVTDTTTGE
ncbi:RodZ domain-containing protein [Paenibacillus sp. FA6]|uniref:RodZ domain-containing protein n=1 Tax=Paenibacillus sp. FA6 TaxID=3413029 RepID=UPI003F65E4B3